MEEKELYWLAGILEGEGSFLAGPPSKPNTPAISISSTDEDVIIKVAGLFGVSYYSDKNFKYKNKRWKTPYITRLRGKPAKEMMTQLKPLMSKRRKEQIDIALACFQVKRVIFSDRDIKDIKDSVLCTPCKQLACKYGVSVQTIYNIKNGKRHADV